MTAVQTPPPPSSTQEPSTGLPSHEAPKGPFLPVPPKNFKEAGLDPGIVESLVLKYLAAVGSATGATISAELCLPPESIVQLLASLKQQQIVVYVSAASMGDFTYTLTDAGRDRARRFQLESLYVGPAPVPLEQYIASVKVQTITTMAPQYEDLKRAFRDLLISEEMFQILGPAINSGRGMFLYGYPGNGKTSIAERITRCFGDEIFIPQCVIVDGLIIKIFDATIGRFRLRQLASSPPERPATPPTISRSWSIETAS